MIIKNPLLVIPRENSRSETKIGRRSNPKFLIKKNKFAAHRNARVREINEIFQTIEENILPFSLNVPEDRIFYEVEFHKQALSKSAQPREIFDKNHIDIYAQTSETTFLASSLQDSLRAFKEGIKDISVETDPKGSAYLSAVSRIRPIPKEEKLRGSIDGNLFRGYLFVSDIFSEEDGKKIFEQIEAHVDDVEYFTSESGAKVIYGSFPSSFIDEISAPDPRIPFTKIEKSIEFFLPQNVSASFPVEEVTLGELELDAKVGVLDTGIVPHKEYSNLIINQEDFINDPSLEDLSHGTFVGTRVIFGNDIENQVLTDQKLIPKARVLDIKVMKKDVGANDKEIIDALSEVIKNEDYKDIKVFNLSLNHEEGWEEVMNDEKHFITRELDSLAYNYGVSFVTSAGNHYELRSTTYPDCLFCYEAVITAPADIVNGFAVGSLADTESTRSVALKNEPSPFSRIGGDHCRKPDLVHFGGNCNVHLNHAGLGVKAFSVDKGEINEGIGTSYSAPLVSQILAQTYEYLKENIDGSAPLMDLARALVLHSAEYKLPDGSKIDQRDIIKAVGFGLPDLDRALDSIDSAATFVYWGTLGQPSKESKSKAKYTKHKIKFVVPKELEGRGKKIRVRGTLVYTPLISKSGQQDYCLAEIECNLHYLNSKGNTNGGNLTQAVDDNRLKWYPVKSFEKVCTSYSGGDWELWLTLTTRGDADVDSYLQDYALVISIEDITTDPDNRINVHSVVRQQHRNYLPVGVRVKTRARVSS